MGWTNLPVSTGTDIQSWVFLKQFWDAVKERAWATPSTQFPPGNFQWFTGTVASLTNNNDGTYNLVSGVATTANRWYNYTLPGSAWIPQFYDIIIDDPFDETTCIHTQIVATNTTTTFKIKDVFADLLTGKTLSSTSSLSSRTFYIIRRGGLAWFERYFIYPNDTENYVGLDLSPGALQIVTSLTSTGTTATATINRPHQFISGDTVTIAGAVSTNNHYNGTFTVVVTSDTTFTYTLAGSDNTASGDITALCEAVGANDITASFPVPSLYDSGFELMVYGSDNPLKRITLTGNNQNSLFFARQSYTVAGQYAVIPAGNKYRNYQRFFDNNTYPGITCDCNPLAGPPFRWYHSLFDYYYTHMVDDTTGTTPAPRQFMTLNTNSGTEIIPVQDMDVWTALDDPNNPPDHNYTPDLYRTLRGLQKALENLCTYYLPDIDYTGATVEPSSFTTATWLNYAGINGRTSTTGSIDSGSVSSGITISDPGLPFTPINCFYTTQNTDGTNRHSGTGVLDTATHLTSTSGDLFDTTDTGKTIILSLGWTRKYPNEFMYYYDKQVFIPSLSDDPIPVYVDPPTAAKPGTWPVRNKSTKYKEHDSLGMVRDSNGYRNFVTSDLARYSGDNENDPTIHPETITGNPNNYPYSWNNNYFEGTLDKTNQALLETAKRGTVTSIGTRYDSGAALYITDNTKDWWNGVFGGGVLHQESGVFDSGSSTSGGDSSKFGNFFWLDNYFAGFIVEISQDGGTTFTIKRSIVSVISRVVHWNEPLPVSASGLNYRIRMPKYVLNRFSQRTVTFTLPADGSTHQVTIVGSDDKSLWFGGSGLSFDPTGASYQITEVYPGGVYQFDGTKWTIPPSTDTRTGLTWNSNQNNNLPTHNTAYGELMNGDYITEDIINELYAGLQVLRALKWTMTWADLGGVCNYKHGEADALLHYSDGFGEGAKDMAVAAYNDSCEVSAGNPFAESHEFYNCACFSYQVARRKTAGAVTNLNTYENASIDYYNYALAPTSFDGSGGTATTESSCPEKVIFDANGDLVALAQYTKFDTSGPDNSIQQFSGFLGSLSEPTEIGDLQGETDCTGPGLGIGCTAIQGYVVTKWFAIVRKAVSGGFIYQ